MGRIRRRCGAVLTIAVAILAPLIAMAQRSDENLLIGSDPFFDTSNWDSSLRRQLSDLIHNIQDLDGKLSLPDRPRNNAQRRLTSEWSDQERKQNWSKGERRRSRSTHQVSERLLHGKRAPRVRGSKNEDAPKGKSSPKTARSNDDISSAKGSTDDDVSYYFGSENIEEGSMLSTGRSKKGSSKGSGKSASKSKGKGKGKSKKKQQQQSFAPTVSHAPSISNMPSQPIIATTSSPTAAETKKPQQKPSRRPSVRPKAKPSRRPSKGSGMPTISQTPSIEVSSSPTSAINATSTAPTPAKGTIQPSTANITGSEMPSIAPSIGGKKTTAPSFGPPPPGFVRCINNGNLTCPDPKLAIYCDKYNSESSFQKCLTNCIVGYCCIHDSDTKRAKNCRTNENCNFYIPCYIVWWKIQDTIGPAPYLRLKANQGETFYGNVNDDDFTKNYLDKDKSFSDQLFGHHFLNDDKLPLTKATFDQEKYW